MSTTPSDEELVAAFQSGDIPAFDQLVRRWDRRIQGAIYRLVGNHEEARDLSQEAFLKAYRALGTFKKEARFSSWLYQIAVNASRDRLRRRRRRNDLSLDDIEEGSEPALRDAGPSALDLVEWSDVSKVVAAAMAMLPEEQREVVILKEYEGLTFPEIAEALDVPLSTVKTRLYRGLGQLRVRLERQGIRPPAALPVASA
ncbi:MAG TPA: sigma-70 family RNA polymerase sigma factor [Vicinamibacteria bacterium]|nr:sigma-70 family RNA polymerase sigma factor [Vicinamibacteria bacterium]